MAQAEKNHIETNEQELLIRAICGISYVLMVHQIFEKDEMLERLQVGTPHLTRDIFNKAMEICANHLIVTNHNDTHCFQTLSVGINKHKTLDEVYNEIRKHFPDIH